MEPREPITATVWMTDDDDVKRSKGQVELAMVCEECCGYGKVADYDGEEFQPCPNEGCRGGLVLDDGGEALMELLGRFGEEG